VTKYTLRFGGGGGLHFAWFAWAGIDHKSRLGNDLGFPTSVPLMFTILVRIPVGLFFQPGASSMHIVMSPSSDMFPPKKPGAGATPPRACDHSPTKPQASRTSSRTPGNPRRLASL